MGHCVDGYTQQHAGHRRGPRICHEGLPSSPACCVTRRHRSRRCSTTTVAARMARPQTRWPRFSASCARHKPAGTGTAPGASNSPKARSPAFPGCDTNRDSPSLRRATSLSSSMLPIATTELRVETPISTCRSRLRQRVRPTRLDAALECRGLTRRDDLACSW